MVWWLLITMTNSFFKEIKILKETHKDIFKALKKTLKKVGKASLKRQRTPETTTDTKDVNKLF